LRYLPKSDSERREMLDACGVESPEDLFVHLPEEVRLQRPLQLPPGISEYEIVDYFRQRGDENANGYASFLGAGVYRHYHALPSGNLARHPHHHLRIPDHDLPAYGHGFGKRFHV
jgi:glycine dehydrogenase subunit 1